MSQEAQPNPENTFSVAKAPFGLRVSLIATAVAPMLRGSVSTHRRRVMFRRYELPSDDVKAIQNSALSSLPIVEIHEDFVMNAYVYAIKFDGVMR
jgi:hypothetical protein